MSRLAAALWICAAGAVAMTLFALKHEVQGLERELQMVNRQILADQEALHILNAEWSYLNRPSRLSGLVRRHLDLVEVKSEQIRNIDAVPVRPVPAVKPAPPAPTPQKHLTAEHKP